MLRQEIGHFSCIITTSTFSAEAITNVRKNFDSLNSISRSISMKFLLATSFLPSGTKK